MHGALARSRSQVNSTVKASRTVKANRCSMLVLTFAPFLLEHEEKMKSHAAELCMTLADIDLHLNALCQNAEFVNLPPPIWPRLPDADDEPLLRLAEASGARLITTHNLRHLRPALSYGVSLLLPGDFLRMLP